MVYVSCVDDRLTNKKSEIRGLHALLIVAQLCFKDTHTILFNPSVTNYQVRDLKEDGLSIHNLSINVNFFFVDKLCFMSAREKLLSAQL